MVTDKDLLLKIEHRKRQQTENMRKWRSENKERDLNNGRQYRSNNREKLTARQRAAYKANPQRSIAHTKKWALKNREKVLKRNSEWRANSDAYKLWIEKNRYKVNANSTAYLLRKSRASVKWANSKKIQFFYLIAQNATDVTGVEHQVDHIFPLNGKKSCGLHVENNLQVITKEKNLRKGNKIW